MWTKHEFLCTECDTLMEITTYWKDQFINTPQCPCPHQAVIRINKYDATVADITSPEVVKINSNPYT
jgi:hypothetical protein